LSPCIAAVALLCAACVSDGTSSPRQPPKLVFSETTHDLGRVEAGRQMTAAYAFRNAGGLDLSIENVRAACSCTAALPAVRVIPPGATGAIDVTFDTTREHGHQTHTITVYSNDPAQPVSTLTLVADIDAALAAEPAELYIGHIRRGRPAPNSVRLVGPNARAVSSVETTGTVLDTSLSSSPGKPPSLRVAVKPQAPLGRFKESVLVRVPDSRQPPLAILVVGVVDADVAAATERP